MHKPAFHKTLELNEYTTETQRHKEHKEKQKHISSAPLQSPREEISIKKRGWLSRTNLLLNPNLV